MLLFLIACKADKISSDDITVTVSEEVTSILSISWPNDEARATYVRFGAEGDLRYRTPTGGVEESGSAMLLGMPPSTEVFFEIVDAESDEVLGAASAENGALPAAFAPLTATGSGKSYDGFVATTVLGQTSGPVIFDDTGAHVWWFDDTADWVASGARLSADRQWVIYTNQPKSTVVDQGELVKVSIDGKTVERYTVPGCHHDFAEMPDGSIVVLSQDTRTIEGVDGPHEAVGDQLISVAPDGTQTVVWNIFDDWPEAVWETNVEDDSVNWSHGNAIDYDAATDAWRISFRNFNSIASFDAQSGDVQWVLNGQLSDWTLVTDERDAFIKQHQFEVLDGSILLIDDGDVNRGWSRAVEFSLPEGGGQAEEIWSWKPRPEIQTTVLGDVDRLEDGSTLVMHSTAGQLATITEGGDVRWQLNADLGTGLGYFQRVDSLYGQ